MLVCIVTPSEEFAVSAGVRIRYDRLAVAARFIGHDIEIVPIADFQTRGDFRHDVYIFAKTYTAASCLLAWRMRQCGKPAGVDVFDDYFTQTADARMLRYRRWFAAMAETVDFFLCSTERLGEAIRPLLGGKPLAVIADPAGGVDVQQLEFVVARKLSELTTANNLRVLWFGIGDNPYFPVGIRDLVAFGAELTRLAGGNRDVSLRILTNKRALNTSGLAMLRHLSVPYTIEEWTAEREQQELVAAHVCFLPVSVQPFAQVKSLNRAVTALTAGCQVLAAGFPLYNKLHEYIYSSADELLADLNQGEPRLRPQSLAGFIGRIGELANAYRGAEKMFGLIADLAKSVGASDAGLPGPALVEDIWPPAAKFPVDVAVVHGAQPDFKIHKLLQRFNGVSVKSPSCREDWNFGIRFDVQPGGNYRVMIETDLVELVDPALRGNLVPFGKIKDLEFHELKPGEGVPVLGRAGCYLLQWSSPIKMVAVAPIIMDDMMTILRALFPSMHFIFNDRLAAIAPGNGSRA